ncbi:hypothetical protein [Geobacter sp.]|uniref:hypothetical protein n=1 Tax=Geobacter sp. TaxID=46610 RepID=UPI001AC12081|nr:hypothetical protein [Geobacter sp.]CAG0958363.1 hypothetical protein ANRL4_00509 [Anaerolineae bacterium]
MASNVRPQGPGLRQSCKSLRLTFRVVNREIQLVGYERLDMIPPPSIGERPEAGKHGGFWIELRDAGNRALFHRVLDNPLGNSVEVHSPDGKIERRFGEVTEGIFEVLLPDEDDARSVVLMGNPLVPAKGKAKHPAASGELARFEIPGRGKGGE